MFVHQYIAEYNRIYAETEGFRKQTDNSPMKIQRFNNANSFFGADMANGMPYNIKDRWCGYQPTGQSESLNYSASKIAYYLQPGWNGERQAKGAGGKEVFYSGVAGKQIASSLVFIFYFFLYFTMDLQYAISSLK